MSMPRANSPQSYVKTSPVLKGIADGGMTFRRRSSTGSTPSSRAARSITRSMAYVASGLPAPRYGPVGVVFEKTPVVSTQMAGVVYTPASPPTLLVPGPALRGVRYAPMLSPMATRRPRNRPAGIQRQLGRRDIVAAVLVGDEGLAAVGRPSDGPPQPLRRPEHQRHLRVHAAAHAEAAADLARHHAHVALRHAQDVREDGAAAVRALDARVQRVAGRAPVVLADGGAGLERRDRHAGDREVEPGHVGRGGEGAIDGLAGAGLPDERDIVGGLVPDRRRARAPGIGRRGHRGQRLVLDVHQRRGVGRLLRRLRDHQDHGIADVADPPAGQRRTRRGERRRAAGPLAAGVGG